MLLDPAIPDDLVAAYLEILQTKAASTIDVYQRILHQFTDWLATRPGGQEYS